MSKVKKAFGTKFLLARLSMNFTQAEVAKQIGIHQTHYGRVERGKLGLSAEELVIICDFLRIDFSELRGACEISSRQGPKQENKIVAINDSCEIRKLAEVEIIKRDEIIEKLKCQILALTKFCEGQNKYLNFRNSEKTDGFTVHLSQVR